MRLITLFTICFTITSYAQNKFSYSIEGLHPLDTVIKVDSLSAKQLYDRTINWVKETFVSPDDVILSKIDNEYIRFRGSASNYLIVKALGISQGIDVRYSITIYFKDGRYKFEPTSFQAYYTNVGWSEYLVRSKFTEQYFKKRTGEIRKSFRHFPDLIAGKFNDLLLVHYQYILDQNKAKKDDW